MPEPRDLSQLILAISDLGYKLAIVPRLMGAIEIRASSMPGNPDVLGEVNVTIARAAIEQSAIDVIHYKIAELYDHIKKRHATDHDV